MSTTIKTLNRVLISATCLFSMSNAHADGDIPINCRQVVVGQVAHYEGWSDCLTSIGGRYYRVEQYVPLTNNSTSLISQEIIIYTASGESYVIGSCVASVPFSHYVSVTEEKCDYTPKALIKEYRVDSGGGTYEPGKLIVDFESSDRDGYIVSQKAWIDGVSVPVRFHELVVKPGDFSTSYHIELSVTDDDGYITQSNRTIIVNNLEVCHEDGGFDSVCESEN